MLAAAATLAGQQNGTLTRAGDGAAAFRLAPTAHPAVPSDLSAMWYAPTQAAPLDPALQDFVRGVRLIDEEQNAAAALPLVSAKALLSTPLADYARYYTGLALLRLGRYDAADGVFAELSSSDIDSHLPEDAALRQGEAREARSDFAGAVIVYESLVGRGALAQPQVAWLKLGLASAAAGNKARAVEALGRVYFDYPLSAEADEADETLDRLVAEREAGLASRELARAEVLFKARRWQPAKASYDRAKNALDGAARELALLHRAACDVMLGRHRDGRDALKARLEGPLAEEASYYFITATRGLRQTEEHVRLARAFVAAHPASPWAEEVLNALASAYITDDRDGQADAVFREMLERFPTGRYAERAAWKAGWFAYRQGRFDEAARFFDTGAAAFPRSDYRPSWLYWSGRAADQLGDRTTALARLKLAATDYHNSYYGRLALGRLTTDPGGAVPPSVQRVGSSTPPEIPSAGRVALLLATGLNQEAERELLYAQRAWGDSSRLQATLALVNRRLGNVRAGINLMKRAYPQYLAAGGELLPREILEVIFPVDYWPLLKTHAEARGLDPYLVAALVAQESNFDRSIRSSANAIGLMQVLPSTGRTYARKLRISPFSTRRLTDAETNVRIGTAILADTIKKFGGAHFALAAYNAGDSRVAAWRREKPGLPQDEFIDDIPFPETQNYVKRVLGTAEDYRRLYGSSGAGRSEF